MALFFAFDSQTQESWSINQPLFLTSRPTSIRQFARYLADELEPMGGGRDPSGVPALNGRPRQLLIGP